MSIYHPDGYRVLVCGNREWEDRELVETMLVKLARIGLVIEGGARGADFLGGVAAEKHGIAHAIFNANWDYYSKAAGPIRNGWMLRYGRPDLVLAFHDDLEVSKGTKSLVHFAREMNIPVRQVKGDGEVITL